MTTEEILADILLEQQAMNIQISQLVTDLQNSLFHLQVVTVALIFMYGIMLFLVFLKGFKGDGIFSE